MRKKRAHEQEGLPVGRRVVARSCGAIMNPITLVMIILSCGAVVVALAAPYSLLVRLFMVAVVVAANIVFLGMKHFQEAGRKVKDAPEDWFK